MLSIAVHNNHHITSCIKNALLDRTRKTTATNSADQSHTWIVMSYVANFICCAIL